jgi:hypothetical protein
VRRSHASAYSFTHLGGLAPSHIAGVFSAVVSGSPIGDRRSLRHLGLGSLRGFRIRIAPADFGLGIAPADFGLGIAPDFGLGIAPGASEDADDLMAATLAISLVTVALVHARLAPRSRGRHSATAKRGAIWQPNPLAGAGPRLPAACGAAPTVV